MKHDEILQAAKEAGIEFKPLPRDLYCEAWLEQLERFTAIIEKRTIERCALVCEEITGNDAAPIRNFYWSDCAAAIRKLGEQ